MLHPTSPAYSFYTSQILPFQLNHFSLFPAHQVSLRSLGSSALPTSGESAVLRGATWLIEVFWSAGNSMCHEHNKTSFCLQSNTDCTPTCHTVLGHQCLRNILHISEQKKNSHFECKKWPTLFIPGLKRSPTATRMESICINI